MYLKVLTYGFVQEDPGPLPGPELGLADKLNAAGLHAVHVDPHADDEGVGVLREHL